MSLKRKKSVLENQLEEKRPSGGFRRLYSRLTAYRSHYLPLTAYHLPPPLPHLSRLLILPFLLASCDFSDSGPDPTAYRLSSLSPNPVEAGGTVTLEGNLPAGTTLKIAGETLVPKQVSGSWQVTLSQKVWAGTQTLSLEKAATGSDPALRLSGSLTVLPRLEQAEVDGGTLRIGALGWKQGTAMLPGTQLELEGQLLPLEQEGLALKVALPKKLWGTLTLRLQVAGLLSAPYTLSYQAAGVQGRVVVPSGKSLGSGGYGEWGVGSGEWVNGEWEAVNKAKEGLLTPQSLPAASSPTRFLVRTQTGRRDALLGWVASLPGLTRARSLEPLEALSLRFADEASGRAAQIALLAHPEWILSLEGDPAVSPDASSLTPSALSPQASSLGTQWFWPLLKVPDTWKRTQGEGVTVAVLDTGVLSAHPDLKLNLLPGYDFVDDDSDPQDKVGHGTHVAGLIAAKGLVSGAAPRAKLLPVRVLSYEGGDTSNVVRGLLWAAGLSQSPKNPNPAQVVNLSLGASSYSDTLAEAVRLVQQKGILIVAATGNAGGSLAYPAALEGVLAVTSVSGPTTPYQPSYANRGPGTDLAAYGGDFADRDGNGQPDTILSTDRNPDGTPGYGLRAGTSMAAPEVSGIAALALSSGIPRTKLKETLERTALDLGSPGYDLNFGYGLVQAGFSGTGGKKVYVLALKNAQVIGWTVTDSSGKYALQNLPPETRLEIVAASDADGDGILAEKGEWVSSPQAVVLSGGKLEDVTDLKLAVSSGTSPYTLP